MTRDSVVLTCSWSFGILNTCKKPPPPPLPQLIGMSYVFSSRLLTELMSSRKLFIVRFFSESGGKLGPELLEIQYIDSSELESPILQVRFQHTSAVHNDVSSHSRDLYPRHGYLCVVPQECFDIVDRRKPPCISSRSIHYLSL